MFSASTNNNELIIPANNDASVSNTSTLSRVNSDSESNMLPEIIPIEGDYFITISKYNYVLDNEQTTRDWIRHQDGIFLNGFSLRTIVDNLKKEYLKELIDDFLYADKDPLVITRRLTACQEFISKFFDNADDMKSVTVDVQNYISDHLAVKLANILKSINFDLNIHDTNKQPLYQFSDSHEMKLLRELVCKFGRYFSTDAIGASIDILKKILNDYLFISLNSAELRLKYSELFFSVVHHGGALYSLFTAHLHHINPRKYVIKSTPCIDQSKIEFTSTEENIYIKECTPILSINLVPDIDSDGLIEDDNEDSSIRNADGSNVMETIVTHVISRDELGKAVLKIESAFDYSFNFEAREILLGEWFRLKQLLSNYANNYIHNGHSAMLTNAVFEIFPWIKNTEDEKKLSPFRRMFIQKDGSYQGSKILLCLGKCFPSYAENVLVDLVHYAEFGKDVFLRTIKLLQLMGRNDLANKAILPYLVQAHIDHSDQLKTPAKNNDKQVEAAYKYMITSGFLSEINQGSRNKVPDAPPLIIQKSENNIIVATNKRHTISKSRSGSAHSKSF